MKFNKDKCCILHLQWGTPGCTDRLGNEMLENSTAERDLGVLVNDKLDINNVAWKPGRPTVSWGASGTVFPSVLSSKCQKNIQLGVLLY